MNGRVAVSPLYTVQPNTSTHICTHAYTPTHPQHTLLYHTYITHLIISYILSVHVYVDHSYPHNFSHTCTLTWTSLFSFFYSHKHTHNSTYIHAHNHVFTFVNCVRIIQLYYHINISCTHSHSEHCCTYRQVYIISQTQTTCTGSWVHLRQLCVKQTIKQLYYRIN